MCVAVPVWKSLVCGVVGEGGRERSVFLCAGVEEWGKGGREGGREGGRMGVCALVCACD